jgi:hypothetical protein
MPPDQGWAPVPLRVLDPDLAAPELDPAWASYPGFGMTLVGLPNYGIRPPLSASCAPHPGFVPGLGPYPTWFRAVAWACPPTRAWPRSRFRSWTRTLSRTQSQTWKTQCWIQPGPLIPWFLDDPCWSPELWDPAAFVCYLCYRAWAPYPTPVPARHGLGTLHLSLGFLVSG